MAKRIDLGSIAVENVIVHDIPHHKKDDHSGTPNYSEHESGLTDGLRLFFKDKMVQALGSDKAFNICFNDSSESKVSWHVGELLEPKKKADFAATSKGIAKQLYDIQVGSNAAGIMVVILGKVNGSPACMILKLERDKGAQLRLDESTHSYNIEEVKDLMLTDKTKIFKVAMFILKKEFACKYDGVVMDYQIDVKAKKEVTTFFIEKFLGCRPFLDPKITTKKFYTLTRSYLDTFDDVLQKAKGYQDLNSYLQKNTGTLSPKEFADDYLSTTGQRNNYKDFLESKNFKFGAFTKDTNLIDSKINKIVLSFENDISIIGNKGAFNKNVKLTKMENGQHKAEVISKIKKVV